MSTDLGTATGKIIIDASGVAKGAVEAGRSIQRFQSNVTTAMVTIGVAMGAATAAVGLMKKGWETFERGAKIDALENRFERLADSIGSSGDVLMTRLKESTSGMMTSAELMESATGIMSLGLGKTEDQTVRLATVVGKLGWDMQQVVMTMANNSKMRLDQLGLSVEDVTRRTAALRETGMSLDAAFDLAVIEAGEAKVELLGDVSGTTAGKIDILKSAWAEAKDVFAVSFSEGIVEQLDTISKSVDDLAPAIEEGMSSLGRRAGNIYGKAVATAAADGLYLDRKAMEDQLSALGVSWRELGRARKDAIEATGHSWTEIANGGEEMLAYEAEARKILKERYGLILLLNDANMQRDFAEMEAIYGEEVEETTDALQAAGRASLNMNTHLIASGEHFKEAAAGSGKFGSQLDELADKAARTQEALDAAAQRATAYADAFGAVEGDYTTELPDADEPLVTPESTVSVRTVISGPTEEQRALAERYGDELERLRETYTELTGGVGTFGMEQDKLNERIGETAGEIAYYEGLLAGIPPTVDNVSTSQQGLSVNVDAARQALYDQLVEIDAAPEVIAAYAMATGIMSEEQAEAALMAARLKLEIEALALKMKENPDFSLDAAMAELDALILKMETGAKPAADELPTILEESGGIMAAQATMMGEDVPANMAAGITENLATATDAATAAAVSVTEAMRTAHGDSPATSIFAAMAADNMLWFAQGVGDNQGEAVAAVETAGQATIDAWDPTIDAADAIGVAFMDGIIAGIESRQAALNAKMQEVSDQAYRTTQDANQIESPSQLYATIGTEIIAGIVEGLDEEKDTLYGKMADIADDLYRVATAGLAWLSDPLELRLGTQTDALDEFARQFEDALRPFGDLELRLGAGVVDQLRGMDAEALRSSLYGLRYSNEYMTSPAVAAEVERLIALAEERRAAEEAMLATQRELAEVEERRLELEREQSRLNFLQSQIDLVNTIKELGLSTSILQGLELGLDANAGDLIDAMEEVVRQLIEAAEDELEIASPSQVGYGLMENFMGAMERGITDNARAPVDALAQAYDAMLETSERMARLGVTPNGVNPVGRWLSDSAAPAAPARGELNQHVTIYGGVTLSPEARPQNDPLRELYFAQLGYQQR